jgi:hypothetical protein
MNGINRDERPIIGPAPLTQVLPIRMNAARSLRGRNIRREKVTQ